MSELPITFHAEPKPMANTRMVLGFDGWMDGGDVSTGTVRTLIDKLGALPLATIDPEDFYILNMPGPMEISALFRPHAKIEDGLVLEYQPPRSVFHCHADSRLILLLAREPNLRWGRYAECLFAVAERFDVRQIYFVGSVAGLTPHTREPRLFASFSDPDFKPAFEQLNVRLSNYEGPASLVTLLMREAARREIAMVSLVAEIPAYVQGRNHRCIESVTRRLAGLLELPIDLADIRMLADRLEQELDKAVEKHPELAERITQLEANYDNDVFDTEMGDLKDWLHQQGLRLD